MKQNPKLFVLAGLFLLLVTWSQQNADAQVNAPDPMPAAWSLADQQADSAIAASLQSLQASVIPHGRLRDPAWPHPTATSTLAFTRSPSADAFIWEPYPQSNYGRDINLRVADNANSLLQWSLSDLPSMAMVDYGEIKIRLKQTTGVPTVTVGVHPVTSAWGEDHATWIGRTTTAMWSTPGGDYGPAVASQTLYTATNTVYSWPVTDLVAEWHSGHTANQGVLLSGHSDPPGSFSKVLGSKEDSAYKPTLSISYTLGPVCLSVASPITRGVPSPDWYRFQADHYYWNAVAIRPLGVDYGLALYDTETYANLLVSSTHTIGQVGYVLVDGNHVPAQALYPKVTQRSGRGNYHIERGFSFGNLGLGPNGPFTMRVEGLVQLWDVWLISGTTYTFRVQPASGEADLSVRLHQSTFENSTTWFQDWGDAVASADSRGKDEAEYFSYTAPASDWYGFLVINHGADSNTSYMIYMDDAPPTGSLEINDGSLFTNDVSVTLSLSTTGSEADILDMRLGNTSPFTAGHPTMPWSTTVPWTLSLPDGAKTVYGQFRNKAGVWSSEYSSTIILDTQKPTSSAESPGQVLTGTIPVTWTASDTLSGISSTDLWVRFGVSETLVPLAQTKLSGTFNYSPTYGPGIYYFATVATDGAGNREDDPPETGDTSTDYGGSDDRWRVYLPLVQRPPILNPINNPDGDGTYAVSWNPIISPTYSVLEESRVGACVHPAIVPTTTTMTYHLFTGQRAGRYSYRVKAGNSLEESDWSDAELVDVLWEEEDHVDKPTPNVTPDNGPIISGLTYSGTLIDTSDHKDIWDYFYFDLCDEDGLHDVEIQLTHLPEDYNLYLFNENQFSTSLPTSPPPLPIKQSINDGRTSEQIIKRDLPFGRYYIMVKRKEAGSSVPYYLRAIYQ